MTRKQKNKSKVDTNKAAASNAADAQPESVDPTMLCNLSAFYPHRLLSMEQMLREVVQKNQALENANLQLHTRIYELEANQDHVQQTTVAAV